MYRFIEENASERLNNWMMELGKWQKRFWLDNLLKLGNAANIAMVFRVKGALDTELLVHALRMAVVETESMRCVYTQTNGKAELTESKNGCLCVEIYEGGEKDESYWDTFGRRPFCLEEDLPVRLLIMKDGTEGYRIEFAFHHICVDLVSLADFWRLLADCYTVLLKGGQTKLVKVPLLKDYLLLEKGQISLEVTEKGLSYWRQYLAGLQVGVVLPPGTSEPGCLIFKMGNRLYQGVERLAGRLQTTPFRVLMSAWLWTLSAYSGNRCPAVSYAVNVRPAELDGLIAPFVNNLPWGMSLEANPSFKYCVAECTRQRREARPYQTVSITEIMEDLRHSGALQEGVPFLNTAINYAAWGISQRMELPGVQVEFEQRIVTDSYFDLTLEIEPEIPGYSRVVYGNGLDRKIISGMLRFWRRILLMACRNPEIRFADVPLLTHKEESLFRTKSGEMELGNNREFIHFLEKFCRIAVERGDKVALYSEQGNITYRELEHLSNHIACVVRRESGGRPVGICLERNCNYIAVILGILKAGVPYVPLDVAYPAERLKFMTEDCDIRLVITRKELAGMTGSGAELYIGDLFNMPEESVSPAELVLEAGQTAYIIYTSGTTGKPKGVPVNFGHLSCLIRNAVRLFRLNHRSVQLQYANLAFDASVMEIFPALSVGATLCLVPEEIRKNPQELVEFIRKYRVSVAYVAPVMLARMEGNLPLLRVLLVGGESTPAEVLQKWQEGRRLLNVYGPTECTVFATVGVMNRKSKSNDIGSPVNGVCAYVMDEYGRMLPDGISGELCLGGWQLTSGYLKRKDLNRDKFRKLNRQEGELRLYRTGDQVVRMANGHFLFTGRLDAQVKIRGFRIELGEIEVTLNQLKGIRQALVLVKGEGEQKRLVAYVRPENRQKIDVEDWRRKLTEQLPAYMLPSFFVIVETFPLTPNGKIDRHRLPEPEWTPEEYVAPQNRIECSLSESVRQILQIERVSVTDDLFGLGLSSLTAVVLSVEALKSGIQMPVSVIYRERSLRKMAMACGQDKICHWYGLVHRQKPVVVLICGHTDFGTMLLPLAEKLKQQYSVLVVESFHDYYSGLPERTDFLSLLTIYEQAISEILPPDTLIYAFTGHCFGGEIAYSMAVKWAMKHVEHPEVWMFNSLACRDMPENWLCIHPLESESQRILWELVLKKQQVTGYLVKTGFMPTYTGRVVLFIAADFTARLAGPDLPELRDEQVIRYMKEVYRLNPENWAVLASHLEVYPMAGDHWSMMRLLNCESGE